MVLLNTIQERGGEAAADGGGARLRRLHLLRQDRHPHHQRDERRQRRHALRNLLPLGRRPFEFHRPQVPFAGDNKSILF